MDSTRVRETSLDRPVGRLGLRLASPPGDAGKCGNLQASGKARTEVLDSGRRRNLIDGAIDTPHRYRAVVWFAASLGASFDKRTNEERTVALLNPTSHNCHKALRFLSWRGSAAALCCSLYRPLLVHLIDTLSLNFR